MYDIIIAGGGSAGCVLAARLSEDPTLDVLLVEAGPDFPDYKQAPDAVRLAVGGVEVIRQLADLDWGYRAEGSTAGGTIDLPRGRLVGGSGAINGCIWLRGLPEDFERWAGMVGPDWNWEAVLPAYRAIEADPAGEEADHGRSGPFRVHRFAPDTWSPTQAAFHAACRELGYGETEDENAPASMGVGQLPLNQTDGLRWGPGRAMLTDEVRARTNLTIRADTRATRLRIDGGRVVGIEVRGGAGPELLKGGEVILSAGAVGSPHILLLSGIGPRADLERHGISQSADVPGVGVGIRDHPKTWVQWRLLDTAGATAADPVLQLSARYTATGSDLRGDMMLYPNSVAPRDDGGLDFRIEAVNNLQRSSGRLRLASADPDVQPHVDLGLLHDARDLERLVDSIERSLALAETAPMRELLGELVIPGPADLADRAALELHVRRTIMTGQHISSSCRMGLDEMAVVGPDCRVRGVGGLRIIDGSVMPDSIRANTHATILAMAQTMAGRIIAGG